MSSTRPEALPVLSKNIPRTLQELKQWVVWKFERRKEKWTKVPYQTDGHHASTTDSNTWASFQDVSKACRAGGWDGIGFVFTTETGIVGIDLDDCRDLKTCEVDPWAQKVIETLDSYTEISACGTGVHILVNAHFRSPGNRKGKVEIYATGRYFTVTGHVMEDRRQLQERQRELDEITAKYLGAAPDPKTSSATAPNIITPSTKLPAWARARLRAAQINSESFAALYGGEWQGRYASQSEADLALSGELLKISDGDKNVADGLFRRSGLYRPKWDRPDYRQRTLDRAGSGDAYSFRLRPLPLRLGRVAR